MISDTTHSKQIVLDKIKLGLETRISRELLLNPKIDIEDWLEDFSRIRIRGYLLGEPVKEINIEYPRDWWQAVKARWFPRLARLKWPVLYTRHHIDIKAVYADFHPSLPDYQHQFVLNYFPSPPVRWE